MDNLIEIKQLIKSYGSLKAVDKVDLSIQEGESLGLVGESGSGKTTLSRLILKLIEPDLGEIKYAFADKELRKLCQIVFQDPQTSLNPRIKIGEALAEPSRVHKMPERVEELLSQVGLPVDFRDRYPHELSGGERQRVGIARALACRPKFLILDEPVSSLDVAIQVQILTLLRDLKKEYQLTYLFIAHDLSTIRYMCDKIAVMRAGRILEIGSKDLIMNRPEDPYTKHLLESSPRF